jgi:hypothetical protein
MKDALIMPLLAAVLFAAGCGGATDVSTTANMRYFNATTGMTGSGAFTTNGQFVTGSALAFGQSTQTCAPVDPGATSFAFGTTNASGTALTGNALATLNNQTVAAGGNYTMVSTGSCSESAAVPARQQLLGFAGDQPGGSSFFEPRPGTEHASECFLCIHIVAAGGEQRAVRSEPPGWRTVDIQSRRKWTHFILDHHRSPDRDAEHRLGQLAGGDRQYDCDRSESLGRPSADQHSAVLT